MNEQSQDLKALLLQTNEEFHHLAAQHHELEDRLHEILPSPTSPSRNNSKKSPSRNASSS